MKKILLFIAYCIFSISCTLIINNNDDEGNDDNYIDSVIMPLKVGNGWIYEYRFTYQGISNTERDTLSIVGEYERGGFLWYYFGEPGSTIASDLLKNDSEGLWFGNVPNEYFDINPVLWAKYPTNNNETFNEVYVNDILESYSTCISTKTDFEDYKDCYAYKHKNNIHFGDGIFYFKPNLGWVGADFLTTDTLTTFKVVLVDYNIEE